jgi:ParB-like nuclease domain
MPRIMAGADRAKMAKPQAIELPPPALPPHWPADHVERRAIAALIPHARNARTHSDAQVDQIAASIREWGWTAPVLIDEEGVIIAGHGRVLAAAKLNIDEVPVMIARGWSDERKRAYIITDNKLTENGGWDQALLSAELIAIGEGLRPLTGFNADELRALSIGVPEMEFPDIPEGERGDFRTMNFTLHKDQVVAIEAAIAAALAAGPFDSANPNRNGNALTHICESYLAWQAQRISA